MTATDPRMFAEFTRAVAVPGGTRVEAQVIEWSGPYTSWGRWEGVVTLPDGAGSKAVDRARRALLQDPRFFRVCRLCGKRKPCGGMHGSVCHGCAERHLGVVH